MERSAIRGLSPHCAIGRAFARPLAPCGLRPNRRNVVTKEGKRFRNTEFFRFDGERIRSIDVYFGASYKDGAFVKQPMSSS
jgi:hypothetical protein